MSLKFANNNSLSAIDTKPSGLTGGALTLLSTQTASSSSTITFDSNIDSTYKEYQFHFINIHPQTDDTNFQVNFRDGSTDYDATKTSTYFRCIHSETGTTELAYEAGNDLAQSTGFKTLSDDIGADADQNLNGVLHLFDPSNTTFVKHFICAIAVSQSANYSMNHFTAGYCNVTAAIDGVQFKQSSGNIDSGIIKMYGVS
tara:strand:+ start:28 stop:627 length:600 start_codon:yes stop_codon:yes gene_type:complete